jgi:hypothetical protein
VGDLFAIILPFSTSHKKKRKVMYLQSFALIGKVLRDIQLIYKGNTLSHLLYIKMRVCVFTFTDEDPLLCTVQVSMSVSALAFNTLTQGDCCKHMKFKDCASFRSALTCFAPFVE